VSIDFKGLIPKLSLFPFSLFFDITFLHSSAVMGCSQVRFRIIEPSFKHKFLLLRKVFACAFFAIPAIVIIQCDEYYERDDQETSDIPIKTKDESKIGESRQSSQYVSN
jgi:hypothetical protein